MAVLSLVLGISILLQFAAAFFALRLTRVIGRRTAWAFIAAAVSLMALRRCITLFGLISGGLPQPPDLLAELVALGTSALMVVGVARIASLFLSIKRSEEMLRVQRDLALALSGATEQDEAFRLCLDAAIRISGMDCGGVYLVDEASGSIDLAFHQGLSVDFITSASHYGADSDSARLIMAGKPVYSQHRELGTYVDKVRLREGLRAIAVIPIRYEGRIIACLNIASHTLDEVPVHARNTLETTAAQIGSTIARVQAEKALQLLSSTVEQCTEGVAVSDLEGYLLFVNNAFAVMHGYTLEELAGEHLSIFHTPEQMPSVEAANRQTQEAGKFSGEIWHVRRDGTVFLTLVHNSLLRDETGNLIGMIGTLRDITERKRAEEALRESEEKYRLLVENSNEVIIVAQDGMLKFLNPQAMEITGYSRKELVSNPFAELIHPDDREMAIKYYLECLQGEETLQLYDLRIIDKDGNTKWLESNAVLITWEGRPATLNFLSDITKRKRAMAALRQRNRDLALLNRVSQVFISTLDLDQVLFNVLEEVRHLLDVVACSVWLVDPATDELVCWQATGPRNEIVRGWRLSPGQGIVGGVARSGESLIVPDVWADERHFKGVDQQTGLPLRSILSVPLRVARSETGHSGVIGVLQVVDTEVNRFSPTDLELLESLVTTAAIAIENAQLYEHARQDAETRSTLLREVNHRVKNNLSAIIGLLYAERRYAGADDQAVYQSITQALVNRVQGLATVHSLLSASEWSPLRLGELATQVVRSSLQILPPDKRMSVDVAPSPVRVTPDQAHNLALVINELATNAVKHTLRERDTAHITVRVGLEGDMVLFEFRDDGPGYLEEMLRLERHGVGFDLIQNVVRKNLRGELSLHNDRGAVAVIRFAAQA